MPDDKKNKDKEKETKIPINKFAFPPKPTHIKPPKKDK
jgi:hypothetical protein